MGLGVLVLGASGTGKTASLRNFNKSDVIVLNVADKPLSFKGKLNTIKLRNLSYSERYEVIKKCILKYQDKCKTFVIDDSQYLLSFELFQRSGERGYDKFTEMALKFKELLDFIQSDTNDEVTVYLLHHTDENEGRIKIKTIGKMLDEKLTIEGLFSIVLLAMVKDGNYKFLTKTTGLDPVKTPIGMFEQEEIDNDLKEIDKVIREYYEMMNPYNEKGEETNESISN